MEVMSSKSFKMVLILVSVFTFGIGGIVMYLTTRSWPKLVDDQGIVLRNGKRLNWGEFVNKREVEVVDQLGRHVTSRLELIFGKNKAKIVPQSLADGYKVLELIESKLPNKQ